MFGIAQQLGFFLIRQHKQTPWKPLSEKEFVGETETGKVYEQKALLTAEDGSEMIVRRIVVELHTPTRDGETEIGIFTNIPVEDADAIKVAEMYRQRWGIETAFQKLEGYLNSEINTLGYPKAALFSFCLALVAFNIYAIVMAALRVNHPDTDINDEVSDYYVADEVSTTHGGMLIATTEEDWAIFINGSIAEFTALLLYLSSKINLAKFKKHKRGPKKPPRPKNAFKGKPHVSTAKLLAARASGTP
jgi:hypothetical protein